MTSRASTYDSLTLRLAESDDAPLMHTIIQQAFAARRHVEPQPAALSETVHDVQARLEHGQIGIVASIDSTACGCLFLHLDPAGDRAWIHRVSVLEAARRHGVAYQMLVAAADLAVQADLGSICLYARKEFPEIIALWQAEGFWISGDHDEHSVEMTHMLPIRITVPTSDDMKALGARLAGILHADDLVVASGDLGSGKTTLTQGLGAAMGVDGVIASPTFVLSRIHPPSVPGSGPGLVHVDAYRLGSAAELADIDIDTTVAESVTVIEWGEGLAEQLSDDRLEITIERSDNPADDTRQVTIAGVGSRWERINLHDALGVGTIRTQRSHS